MYRTQAVALSTCPYDEELRAAFYANLTELLESLIEHHRHTAGRPEERRGILLVDEDSPWGQRMLCRLDGHAQARSRSTPPGLDSTYDLRIKAVQEDLVFDLLLDPALVPLNNRKRREVRQFAKAPLPANAIWVAEAKLSQLRLGQLVVADGQRRCVAGCQLIGGD